MQDAKDKIKTIKDLAKAGVPKAKQALTNLEIAENLEKGARPWWDRFRIPLSFDTYDKGAKS